MHTVGEILKRARLEKKLTLDEAEKQLRIRKKFLEALEQNEWDRLPSLPYIKGFLRNYSMLLDLKPEEMLAIFRRQYHELSKAAVLPDGMANPINDSVFRITPRLLTISGIVLFFIIFFGYLLSQYQAYTNPPNLIITSPKDGETVQTESIEVVGKTDRDTVVSLNNRKIAVTDTGDFKSTVTLTPGINTIVIDSVSKHGKKRTLSRTVSFTEP